MRSLRILVLAILTAVYVSAAPRDDPKLLVHSNANLRELASDRSGLRAHAFAYGLRDLSRERRLEAGGELRERFYLLASTLERGVDVALGGPASRGFLEALSGACDRHLVHGRGR